MGVDNGFYAYMWVWRLHIARQFYCLDAFYHITRMSKYNISIKKKGDHCVLYQPPHNQGNLSHLESNIQLSKRGARQSTTSPITGVINQKKSDTPIGCVQNANLRSAVAQAKNGNENQNEPSEPNKAKNKSKCPLNSDRVQ